MRVLMLHNAGNLEVPSGERIAFDADCRGLTASGIEVVQYLIDNADLGTASLSDKWRAAMDAVWSRRAAHTVARLIDEHRPDIVHAHNVFPRLSTSIFWACQRARVPVVHTLHNFRYLCVEGCFYRANTVCQDCLVKSRWSGIRHRCAGGSLAASALLTVANLAHVRQGSLFSTVDRFICVSQRLRDIYLEHGFPAEKLVVKYHGIDLPKNATVHYSGRKDVLFVGRLNPAKGTAVLRDLPALLPDYTIRVIGAGPEMPMLRAHFEGRGTSNVCLLGRFDPAGVRAQLANASCVLIPSTCPESFGLVAAEAMAVGTPVVASDIGALTELMAQSGAGVVVPFNQGAGPYARAVREIVEQETVSCRMGAAGIRFAEEHLSLEASTRALIQIYESVTEPSQAMACL